MWVGHAKYQGSRFFLPSSDKNHWIIAKPDKKESVKELFKETSIKITLERKKNLFLATGLRECLDEYVSKNVSDRVS